MSELTVVIAVSWLAGLAAFFGSLVARYVGVPRSALGREVLHGVVAFGGGVLVAAVAYALTPEAIAVLGPWALLVTFSLGGVLFCVLDAQISRRGGSKAQFMAMVLDFVPEAISLGAVFGHDPQLGILLALFIAAQNLPEGFNSFREIAASGIEARTALGALFAVSLLGPMAASSGYYFLHDKSEWTAMLMSFAAGGILYLIFQDIAPQAKMRRHWKPPLGALLGFALGMLGHKLIG